MNAPNACTLDAPSLENRNGELAALANDGLLSAERRDLTLRLRFSPAVRERWNAWWNKSERAAASLASPWPMRLGRLWSRSRPRKTRAASLGTSLTVSAQPPRRRLVAAADLGSGASPRTRTRACPQASSSL